MFKKIEIWILYLVLVLVFISYIIFGSMVLREHGRGFYIPIISPISKAAYFLANIPRNINGMFSSDVNKTIEERFEGLSGFVGDTNEKEKYLLLSRYDGDIKESVVELIDLQNFDLLHSWNPDINSIIEKVDKIEGGEWEFLMRDKNNSRFLIYHPLFIEGGSLLFQDNSPLMKINNI